MKEAYRKIAIAWSGSMPVSIHAARPAGDTHFCIYDANTVLSVIFDELSFVIASYDSPTRPGVRVVDRPFLEVRIEDSWYFMDALTKRMFESTEFERRYHVSIKDKICNKDFNEQQKALYQEQTEPCSNSFGSILSLTLPFKSSLSSIPKFQEYLYEIEESKKYFPEAWIDYGEIVEAMQSDDKMWQYIHKKTNPNKKENS